jgi:hypothetical protein
MSKTKEAPSSSNPAAPSKRIRKRGTRTISRAFQHKVQGAIVCFKKAKTEMDSDPQNDAHAEAFQKSKEHFSKLMRATLQTFVGSASTEEEKRERKRVWRLEGQKIIAVYPNFESRLENLDLGRILPLSNPEIPFISSQQPAIPILKRSDSKFPHLLDYIRDYSITSPLPEDISKYPAEMQNWRRSIASYPFAETEKHR